MRRIQKLKARARLVLYGCAGVLVPGGVPFGLVDRQPPGDTTRGTR